MSGIESMMESITNVVQTSVEDSSVLVLPIDHDKRHASYRSLIVSAVLLVFAGAVTSSPSDREIGSNVVRAQSGATKAEQEPRVHVLSYVSLAQARDSELFLVDCFRPPAETRIVCLLRGTLTHSESSGALDWICDISAENANYNISAPALNVTTTAAMDTSNRGGRGLFVAHIVECACSVLFVGSPVLVTISSRKRASNILVGTLSRVRVLPPLANPPLHGRAPPIISGAICISDVFWDMASPFDVQFDGMVRSVTLHVQYHLALGFDTMAIYLDIRDPQPFVDELALTLSFEVARGAVTFLPAHPAGAIHRELEFQELLILHSLIFHRGRADWLASFDVDEYFEVMQSTQEYESALSESRGADGPVNFFRSIVARADAAQRAGSGPPTIKVRSQFFWSGTEDWTTDLTSLQRRPLGEFINEGSRTKCLYSTAFGTVITPGVHAPTQPTWALVASPDRELRLLHFKFFGGFRASDGAFEVDDSFALLWAHLGLPDTSCASRVRPRCDRDNSTRHWKGPG